MSLSSVDAPATTALTQPGRRRTWAALLQAGAGGCSLAGLWIARLTLELNPQLDESTGDATLLLLYFAVGYGLVGLAGGALGALVVAGGRRMGLPWRRIESAAAAILGLGPLLYALLLPATGLSETLLSDLLFASRPVQAVAVLGFLALLAGVGLLLAPALRRLRAPMPTLLRRSLPAALWWVAALGIATAGPSPQAPTTAPPEPASAPVNLSAPSGGDRPPPRVLLLVMDGADLDDVILPLARAGELPHFARLMAEGTWGELATLEPTLSPVVWTTLATGKPPAEHGIHHFVSFQLPGLSRPVREFPLHAGLNFRLFPLLEKLPGAPEIRVPCTSDLRRVEALWTLVEGAYPVGVFRWLVTWPPEQINGFVVAGGFGWVQFVDGHAGTVSPRARRAVHPPDLFRRVRLEPQPAVTDGMLEPFVGAGLPVPRPHPHLGMVRSFLADPTSRLLPRLIQAFDARFTAAAFYSVDPFHHYFGAVRGQDGPFSGAVEAAYRHADARLGELLAALDAWGEPVHLILVSDHGFDFRHQHHTWAPPGIFFARGPAFPPGHRVEGLSIYDVAPLVLHLLGLPLAEDMPGTRTGTYRRALAPDYLADHPASRIATYEGAHPGPHGEAPGESPIDEEIRDALRSLGYIQ